MRDCVAAKADSVVAFAAVAPAAFPVVAAISVAAVGG